MTASDIIKAACAVVTLLCSGFTIGVIVGAKHRR